MESILTTRLEHRVLYLLGKSCTAELYPSPLLKNYYTSLGVGRAHTYHDLSVELTGQAAGLSVLSFHHVGSGGQNWGHQAWWQVLSSTEPLLTPRILFNLGLLV